MCHNCNMSTTFGKLLQFIEPELYKEFRIEEFTDNNPRQENRSKQQLPEIKPNTKLKSLIDFKDSVDTLPDGHYAKEYIRSRKIPEQFWKELFFVENYHDWMDKNFPDHGKKDLPSDPRIVMFYTNRKGEITNVTGRGLAVENKLRYVTVKIRDEKKVFGLHRMIPEKRVYIVEGQFDSMFLPNAVASGDSNLNGLASYLYKTCFCEDIVLVYDNQPRNRELVEQIYSSIDEGYKIALLPYDSDAKDINEMIKGGMSSAEVQSLIDAHVYHGLTAKLEFGKWRKC
jgi:hypothetical protein